MSGGFVYPPPKFVSSIYNPGFYLSLNSNGYLTFDYAQTLYVGKSDFRLNYLSVITPGTASNGKALVLNDSGGISGIGSFAATNLTGTLQTGSQTNITTLGTLGSLTVSNAITCGSLTVGGSSITSPPSYVLGITPGTASNGKALVLNDSGGISGIGSFAATNLTGTLQTGSQTNITALGTLDSLAITNGLTASTIITTASSEHQIAAGTAINTTAGYRTYPLVISNDTDNVGAAAAMSFMIDGSVASTSTNTPSAVIAAIRSNGAYATSDLVFYTRSTESSNGPIAERLRISQDGRIHFGSTTGLQQMNLLKPSASCSFRIGSAETIKNCVTMTWNYSSSGSDSNYLSFDNYGTSNALVIKSNNWVGIGLNNPDAQFHADTSIWCNEWFHTKANADKACCTFRGTSYSTYTGFGSYSTTTPSIRFGSYNSTFSWSGYCPVYGGAYTNASDVRLKKDIVDIPYGLTEVMKLRPRRYKWRQTGSVSIGFIAQEVESIIPEPVSIPDGDQNAMNEAGLPINAWGVDLSSLTAVLCKAIQELKAKIDSLEANQAALTVRLNGLKLF